MTQKLDEEERIVVAVHDEERRRIGPHMKLRRSLFSYAPVLPGRALDDLVDKVRSAIEPATPPFSVAVEPVVVAVQRDSGSDGRVDLLEPRCKIGSLAVSATSAERWAPAEPPDTKSWV